MSRYRLLQSTDFLIVASGLETKMASLTSRGQDFEIDLFADNSSF